MFFKYTKWSILWALVILFLCGIPGRHIPHIHLLELISFDKYVHFGMFFLLILLTARGFLLQTSYPDLKIKAKLYSLLICIFYGGLIEILQGTIFLERSADWFDFLADAVGSLVGLLLYNWIEKKILVYLIK